MDTNPVIALLTYNKFNCNADIEIYRSEISIENLELGYELIAIFDVQKGENLKMNYK